MHLFMDIETIPAQAPWVREELAAAVTAPGQFKKPESIAEWLAENRDKEADAAWLKTSFDGGVGQIVCIGWAVDEEAPLSLVADDLSLESERRILSAWFDELRRESSYTHGQRPTVIGHNHVGFDVPFIWKRAIVHGLRPPLWFPRNPKPWADSVVDTMVFWDPTQRAGGSMDRLCRILGIPGKVGMSGADVWPAAQRGEFAKIADYCRGDVERTRALWRRMTFAEK